MWLYTHSACLSRHVWLAVAFRTFSTRNLTLATRCVRARLCFPPLISRLHLSTRIVTSCWLRYIQGHASIGPSSRMPVHDILTVLQRWFPYTASAGKEVKSDHPALSKLLQRPELESLASNPDIQPMLGAARMLSGDSLLPDDHMVRVRGLYSVYQARAGVPCHSEMGYQLSSLQSAARLAQSQSCSSINNVR